LRIFLTILLSFYTLFASSLSIFNSQEESVGCKIALTPNEKPKCDSKTSKKISIAPIVIEHKKDKKIEQLTKELDILKKERQEDAKKLDDIIKQFVQYKLDKDRQITKLKSQLHSVKKELSKNKRKLTSIQKSIKKKKKIKKIAKKRVPKKTKKVEKIAKTKKIIKKSPPKEEPMPELKSNTPWIDIVVEDDLDIYQLALLYYKDKKEYKRIYLANKDVIGKNYKIQNGMSLKIPITDKFHEQPMFINIDK
jgi:hypothetical protein